MEHMNNVQLAIEEKWKIHIKYIDLAKENLKTYQDGPHCNQRYGKCLALWL